GRSSGAPRARPPDSPPAPEHARFLPSVPRPPIRNGARLASAGPRLRDATRSGPYAAEPMTSAEACQTSDGSMERPGTAHLAEVRRTRVRGRLGRTSAITKGPWRRMGAEDARGANWNSVLGSRPRRSAATPTPRRRRPTVLRD